jgi:hypothetical protein
MYSSSNNNNVNGVLNRGFEADDNDDPLKDVSKRIRNAMESLDAKLPKKKGIELEIEIDMNEINRNSNTTDDPSKIPADNEEEFDYEEALSIIGFGKFQYILFVIMTIANASDAVELICISFVMPSAECDLNMTTEQKGYLSSVVFIGIQIDVNQ